ncbi:MAG TPA: RNA 3'-terminal phosphate cyclase [archaeon]|nr:RNA 3'-terminal phosphate cyclase [archaeon]
MIGIDGSHGEAGGQILRTAVALSAVTQQPCHVFNIRKGRCNPGLQAQHLAGVKAVGKLCDAKIEGLKIGSEEIVFHPGKIKDGLIEIDVGTAGAISLVLQSLMIPAIHCKNKIDIKIAGGTMVRWAPTVGYIQNVTLPMLRKIGYRGEIKILNHGFYPKGGGLVEAIIEKSEIKPIELLKRGKAMQVKGTITVSENLQGKKVAERMEKECKERLFAFYKIKPEIEINYVSSLSTGGGVDLYVLYEEAVLGSNALCDIKKSAEKVADEAVNFLIYQDKTNAPLDEYMEDQILPYIALAGSGKVKVPKITSHTRTNIHVIEQFLPVKFVINEKEKIIYVQNV